MAERTTPRSICWLHARNHVWANGWYPALDNGARFLLALCLHADRQRLPDESDIHISLPDIHRLAGGTPSSLKRWRATCVKAGVIRYRPGSGSLQPPSYAVNIDRLARGPSARRDAFDGATHPEFDADEDGAVTQAEIDRVKNGPGNSGPGPGPKTDFSPYSAPP